MPSRSTAFPPRASWARCPRDSSDRPQRSVKRRAFLRHALAGGFGAALAPAILPAAQSTPTLPQGVAVGDAGSGRAVVWSRCDRPARLFVDYATTPRFADVRTVRGPAALE